MLGTLDTLAEGQQGSELVAGPGRIPRLPVQKASSLDRFGENCLCCVLWRVVRHRPRAMIARASCSGIGGPSTGWPVSPATPFMAA